MVMTHTLDGGWVCIVIKNNLNFKLPADLPVESLELLAIEICRPHSSPFLVVTWYRPSTLRVSVLSAFQIVIDMTDVEKTEYYLLEDFNCNLLSARPDGNTIELLDICNIHNLSQGISLIDLCFTNYPDMIKYSGAHSLAISDCSLMYMIYPVIRRNLKNFNYVEFLSNIQKINSHSFHVILNKKLFNFFMKGLSFCIQR